MYTCSLVSACFFTPELIVAQKFVKATYSNADFLKFITKSSNTSVLYNKQIHILYLFELVSAGAGGTV